MKEVARESSAQKIKSILNEFLTVHLHQVHDI